VLGQHVIVAMVPGSASPVGGGAASADGAPEERVGAPGTPAAGSDRSAELRRRLELAPPAEQHEILVGVVRQVVATVLRLDGAQDLDRRSRLMDLGIDSLMALEVRKRLGAGLGLARALPATLIFDHPSIDAIARFLGTVVAPPRDETRAAGPAAAAPDRGEAAGERLSAEDVEALADEDVEALLLKRLETMR
jgi:hypothetical protein